MPRSCRRAWMLAMFPLLTVCAQTSTVVGAGYGRPSPVTVAPGQVITLFVDGAGKALTQPVRAPDGPWPTSLAGISVTLKQANVPDQPAPILEVRPFPMCSSRFIGAAACGVVAAITVQVPYLLLTICVNCLGATVGPPPQLFVTENGQEGAAIALTPLGDQIHVLTACDVIFGTDGPGYNITGLPCSPMVIHGDGRLVSAENPAKGGEELAAYVVGLGLTNPLAMAGQPPTEPIPTFSPEGYLIDYNFRPNAPPTKPLPPFLENSTGHSVWAGLAPNYVGLYQINFIVPSIPSGTRACGASDQAGEGGYFVRSNLTVSFGGGGSFDGALICVAVAN